MSEPSTMIQPALPTMASPRPKNTTLSISRPHRILPISAQPSAVPYTPGQEQTPELYSLTSPVRSMTQYLRSRSMSPTKTANPIPRSLQGHRRPRMFIKALTLIAAGRHPKDVVDHVLQPSGVDSTEYELTTHLARYSAKSWGVSDEDIALKRRMMFMVPENTLDGMVLLEKGQDGWLRVREKKDVVGAEEMVKDDAVADSDEAVGDEDLVEDEASDEAKKVFGDNSSPENILQFPLQKQQEDDPIGKHPTLTPEAEEMEQVKHSAHREHQKPAQVEEQEQIVEPEHVEEQQQVRLPEPKQKQVQEVANKSLGSRYNPLLTIKGDEGCEEVELDAVSTCKVLEKGQEQETLKEKKNKKKKRKAKKTSKNVPELAVWGLAWETNQERLRGRSGTDKSKLTSPRKQISTIVCLWVLAQAAFWLAGFFGC